MSKVRVYEIAKEFDMDNKDFISRIEKLGIAVKSHSSTLSEYDVERIRREFAGGEKKKIVEEKRVKLGVIRRRRVAIEPAEEINPPEGMPDEIQPPPAEIEAVPGVVSDKVVEPQEPEQEVTGVVGEAAKKEDAVTEDRVEPAAPAKEVIEDAKPATPKTITPEITPSEIVMEAAGEKPAAKVEEETLIEKPEKKPVQTAETPAVAHKKKAEAVPHAVPEAEKPAETSAPAEEKPAKKKKQAVEVLMDAVPPPKKKALAKHRVEKKARKLEKGIDTEKIPVRRAERKEAVVRMKKTEITTPKAIKRRLKIGEAIRVGDLAKKIGVKSNEVIRKLISLGMMVTINQSIDFDVASLVAGEFGYQIEQVGLEYDEIVQDVVSAPEKLKPRAPVVTVMGHVDHGKTSLLDAIRETNVIEGESGGITQAIGAYHVHINNRDITFVDTPGHEAFTSMRARGAQVTDIVVLVVAADDGVMDQTVEAINHSKAAGVPIIVAINKIDKQGANPDQIKQRLSDYGLIPEAWGGDTIYAEVSAKQKIGIEDLLELILLQADIMELKADPDRPARGVIIESRLDKGRGPVATVIIQEGTLTESDAFVSKTEHGRVRALISDKGVRLEKAGPATPVEVIGFSKVPKAGMDFTCVEDDKRARSIAEYWTVKEREKELSKSTKLTLEQLYERIREGVKEFNVIMKADVQGSIEALSDALLKLSTEDVKLEIIHSSTGAITETDVLLASASDAIIIGFKVRPDARVTEVAEREGVEIKLYDVIYNVIADVRAGMEGLLEPLYEEVLQGRAEVRDLFKVPKVGIIAGSYVLDGKVVKNSKLKLVRDGIVIYDGRIISLRRFKDDAKEVLSGFECGIGLEGFNDIKVGDIIESYIEEEVERTL